MFLLDPGSPPGLSTGELTAGLRLPSVWHSDLSPVRSTMHVTFARLWPSLRDSSVLAPTLDDVDNSQAYSQTYDSLIQDVQNLMTLHPSTAGTRGRPPGDTGPLLRSMLALLHTGWENYVERVAI